MLNSNPANARPASQASSDWPVLEADPTYVGSSIDYPSSGAVAQIAAGFDGDGDVLQLPTSYTGDVVYYDNAGNQVTTGDWASSFTVADCVSAGATGMQGWGGFSLSKNGSLLYWSGTDNIDTIFLGTITKAGVVNVIGSDTFSTLAAAETRWVSGCIGTIDYLTGNFVLMTVDTSTDQKRTEINISTGAIITEAVNVAGVNKCTWETTKGNYGGVFSGELDSGANSAFAVAMRVQGSNGSVVAGVPGSSNVPSGVSFITVYPLYWRGGVVFWGAYSTDIMNIKACTILSLNKFIDAVAKRMGVSK